MIRVGWLVDDPGYLGGAELTAREFRDAAPDDVEIVDCPPGAVVEGLDRYAIFNCVSYSLLDVEKTLTAPTVKYVNDAWPEGDPEVRLLLLARKTIFTSPLHLRRFPWRSEVANPTLVPPAIDVEHLRSFVRENRGSGNVCVGRMAYGKGAELLASYRELVDVYSTVELADVGNLRYRGPLDPDEVPKTLAEYGTFVFLPTATEPFGRAVVEAWAVGLSLVVNGNVGARYWIEEKPEELLTASKAFYGALL